MLKNHLNTIKSDLSSHHRSKSQLLNYYIQLRLTKSLQVYYKDLNESVLYLSQRKSQNILRKL